jgi:hypothetical protein
MDVKGEAAVLEAVLVAGRRAVGAGRGGAAEQFPGQAGQVGGEGDGVGPCEEGERGLQRGHRLLRGGGLPGLVAVTGHPPHLPIHDRHLVATS